MTREADDDDVTETRRPASDDLVVPPWLRTVLLGLVTAAIPTIFVWVVNLEYRTRTNEAAIADGKDQAEILHTIQTDLAVLKVQLADLKKLVEDDKK